MFGPIIKAQGSRRQNLLELFDDLRVFLDVWGDADEEVVAVVHERRVATSHCRPLGDQRRQHKEEGDDALHRGRAWAEGRYFYEIDFWGLFLVRCKF